MKRREIRRGVAVIAPVDTVTAVVGFTLGWLRYERSDEVFWAGLMPMWFGGIKVSAYRGRVISRWT